MTTMTTTATRKFTISPGERGGSNLLIGLCGPSGSGKTLSALRLARGMANGRQGPIVFIDTENGRALHYAGDFDFQHIPFGEPFSPDDYKECIRFAMNHDPAVVIIDSMSHEHEGVGGVLEMHEEELDRLSASNPGRRNNYQAKAWIRPKAARRKLIAYMLQCPAHIIVCYRAAQKLDWKKRGEPEPLGFQPVAAPELKYEMTAMALFQPGANGVPCWKPEIVGEKELVKLPFYLQNILADGKQMSEAHGEALARWAAGDVKQRQSAQRPVEQPPNRESFSEYRARFRGDQEVVAATKLVPRDSVLTIFNECYNRGDDGLGIVKAFKAARPAKPQQAPPKPEPTNDGPVYEPEYQPEEFQDDLIPFDDDPPPPRARNGGHVGATTDPPQRRQAGRAMI